jgi:hypothetical protein
MSIKNIRFSGLIQNRKLSEISGPELLNALRACGWHEGTGTHFLKELRKDGTKRGISTPAQLARAIQRGASEPGRDGKTVHRICNGSAYIVYNASTRTLITFSPGNPPPTKGAAKGQSVHP